MQESTSFARVAITAAFICTGVFSAAIAHVSAADCSQNSAPVARVGDDIVMTREDTARFDASASYDANGDPLSYRWDFDASNGIGSDVSGARTSWAGYQPGTYTVTLSVSDGCATSVDTLTVTVAEEFLFDLAATAREASPGDAIGYLITSTNRTNRQLQNAIMTLDYDERYLVATELNGGYLDGGRLIFRQDKIVQGQTETRAFWFRVSEQMPYGETTLMASATLIAQELSNQGSRSVQTVIGARPTLVVSVKSDRAAVGRGDVVSYSLAYQNHGNSIADAARIYFDFDETNMDVVQATGGPVHEGGRLRWELGAFYPGQSSSQTVTLRVRMSATAAELKNLVRITAANAKNFDQIITTSIAGAGGSTTGLRISALASDEDEYFSSVLSSRRNELITLTITVTNGTMQPGDHVLVSIDYPELFFTVYDRGGAADSGTDASWEIARLEAGESRTFQITLRTRMDAPLHRTTGVSASASARNAAVATAEVVATVTEGEVRVKGFTYELPRTGGTLFPLIGALSALAGVATYLKNGRKLLSQ